MSKAEILIAALRMEGKEPPPGFHAGMNDVEAKDFLRHYFFCRFIDLGYDSPDEMFDLIKRKLPDALHCEVV